MTIEEREEHRKNHEEDRQLWRNTQRQIDALGEKIERFAEESRAADKRLENKIDRLAERLEDKIERFAEESRAADKRLGERIESLVSAIGKALAK
jgi:predicted RNase H-like nuclease (RuvC/YqgF family)